MHAPTPFCFFAAGLTESLSLISFDSELATFHFAHNSSRSAFFSDIDSWNVSKSLHVDMYKPCYKQGTERRLRKGRRRVRELLSCARKLFELLHDFFFLLQRERAVLLFVLELPGTYGLSQTAHLAAEGSGWKAKFYLI